MCRVVVTRRKGFISFNKCWHLLYKSFVSTDQLQSENCEKKRGYQVARLLAAPAPIVLEIHWSVETEAFKSVSKTYQKSYQNLIKNRASGNAMERSIVL